MTTRDRIPGQSGASDALPLLDNGKDRSASNRTPRGRLLWPIRILGLVSTLFLGGVIGLSFQGPVMRAVFNSTGLEPGTGSRLPMGQRAFAVPLEERVVTMPKGDVVALGRLQPAGGVVSVALPQGAGDARIDRILVAEGDKVAKGDVFAVLDSLTLYQSALTSAESTLEIRRATLAQARVQVAATEAELRAQIRAAEATLAKTERELERMTSLLDRGATTQAILENTERSYNTARADLERLQASLTRYQPGLDGQPVDIAVAIANLSAAEAAVAQARSDLDRAKVLSPQDGTIIKVAARAGERAPSGGLLQMGDTARMEAELEIFQTMVPQVRIGQRVSLVSPALGTMPLTGTVSRIGTLVGRQNVTADDPAANTDARVLIVTVALDEASSTRAARYINLEVVARITVAAEMAAGATGQ
jgi:HlyD family secretion protein